MGENADFDVASANILNLKKIIYQTYLKIHNLNDWIQFLTLSHIQIFKYFYDRL